MAMKEIDIREVKENLVHLLADEWALVTAGRGDALGTMTVSWGGIGELWGKDMATIYIRPQRYTKKFLDENNYFTLSFYPEQYKDALRLCGSKSGREINKVEATGLTPCYYEKAPYFEEAKLVLVCRKLYYQDIDPTHFLDQGIDGKWYPQKDYHRMYIGEIVEAYQKK